MRRNLKPESARQSLGEQSSLDHNATEVRTRCAPAARAAREALLGQARAGIATARVFDPQASPKSTMSDGVHSLSMHKVNLS
jgi:hypothetical protein